MPCLGSIYLLEPPSPASAESVPPLCHSAAGRCEQEAWGRDSSSHTPAAGVNLQHVSEPTPLSPSGPRGLPLLREGLPHLQQQHRLPGALQHLTGCRGRQHLGNTCPNPPLCSLKQAFIYAAAGEIYLRICLKYTENYLSPQSTFGYIFPEALRLLSLCRANTAFAGIKLHLCKSLRMPILKSDRGKTSGKNLFFVFSRDLIYLLCIPDLQKAFSSHTLSITILLTGNILLEL